mmetsp:Transcript_18048/g.30318  ORF Transcript_18048/g.30318 Transcript_18048/m.30318 type:complete len:502 (+) Transcript_18048:29-1534(+)
MEVVEQDSIDSEEISDLLSYLLPDGSLPPDAGMFGMAFNKRAFNGWVKQPSACCGAASVAGAWNGLLNCHRRDDIALNHTHVLDMYRKIFLEIIEKKQSAFERKLGAEINSLIDNIDTNLRLIGREIGGKKGLGATKKVVLKILKELATKQYLMSKAIEGSASNNPTPTTGESSSNDMVDFAPRNPIDCIIELLEAEDFSFETWDQQQYKQNDSASVPEGVSKSLTADEEEDESEGEEELIACVKVGNGKVASLGSNKVWDWRKDLMDVIRNKAGLIKLNANKPSTAAIGNWGILDVTKRLSEEYSLGSYINARLFMGKKKTSKSKIDIAISSSDSPETITSQWDALRSSMMRPNEVLLFHLKNHYALIFALREWVITGSDSSSSSGNDDDGTGTVPGGGGGCSATVVTRQLLTARKGQRPVAWMDFDEARQVMLGWDGYKIMAISAALPSDELRKMMAFPSTDLPPSPPPVRNEEALVASGADEQKIAAGSGMDAIRKLN